jgi:hypothetical protein
MLYCMTNPQMYIPARVALGAGAAGPTIAVSELGTLFGFQLRMKAAEHLRNMREHSDRSPTLRATDAVMAQAMTRMADEVDPEHKRETEALYLSNGAEVLAD